MQAYQFRTSTPLADFVERAPDVTRDINSATKPKTQIQANQSLVCMQNVCSRATLTFPLSETNWPGHSCFLRKNAAATMG
jgi:hypothetical protein